MSVVYWAELQGAGRRLGRLADRGAFDTGTHYFAGDIVTHSGTTYVALAERAPGGPTPGSAPDTWGALSDVFGNVPLPPPAAVPHLAAGVPRLQGPYVVDYTDIPHDGNTKDLWTPQVGDVLLRLFCDWQNVTAFDHGVLGVGQGIDLTVSPFVGVIAYAPGTGIGRFVSNALDNLVDTIGQDAADASGAMTMSTAYVFHRTDPVQIQLALTSGTDPGAGHVELYALVARALAVR